MSRNEDCKPRNLLDFSYHQNCYKLIGIDLSRQTNTNFPHLIGWSKRSKFVTKKWKIVNDNQKANYGVGSEVINNTEDSKSNLCDYNDAYILNFYYRTSSNTSCI